MLRRTIKRSHSEHRTAHTQRGERRQGFRHEATLRFVPVGRIKRSKNQGVKVQLRVQTSTLARLFAVLILADRMLWADLLPRIPRVSDGMTLPVVRQAAPQRF